MLLIGLIIHFLITPQSKISKNDLAAARVARMEASVNKTSSLSKAPDTSNYTKGLKSTQKKQMKYLTVLAIVIGVMSVAYSFKPRKSSNGSYL